MKLLTHLYIANLIINEINETGRVKIVHIPGDHRRGTLREPLPANKGKGTGDVKCVPLLNFPFRGCDVWVPGEIKRVIWDHKEYFRAGAAGCDTIPDMEFSQFIIHPFDSGIWLEYMYDRMLLLPEGDERDRAYAFILGWMTHYAADMFGHAYVNEYADGWFPTVLNEIAHRHILLESYMDHKLSKETMPPDERKVSVPVDFIFSCFSDIKGVEETISKIKEREYTIKYGTENGWMEVPDRYRNERSEECQKEYESPTMVIYMLSLFRDILRDAVQFFIGDKKTLWVLLRKASDAVSDIALPFIKDVRDVLRKAADAVSDIALPFIKDVRDVLQKAADGLSAAASSFINEVREVLKKVSDSLYEAVPPFAQDLPQKISDSLSEAASSFISEAGGLLQKALNGLSDILPSFALDILKKAADTLSATALSFARDLAQKISDSLSAVLRPVDDPDNPLALKIANDLSAAVSYIDLTIKKWIDTWGKILQDLLNGKSPTCIAEHLSGWIGGDYKAALTLINNNGSHLLGVSVLRGGLEAYSHVDRLITSIKEMLKIDVKDIFKRTFPKTYELVHYVYEYFADAVKDNAVDKIIENRYKKRFKNAKEFKDTLDNDLKDFGKNKKYPYGEDKEFKAFSLCLSASKLCVMGHENLNEYLKQYFIKYPNKKFKGSPTRRAVRKILLRFRLRPPLAAEQMAGDDVLRFDIITNDGTLRTIFGYDFRTGEGERTIELPRPLVFENITGYRISKRSSLTWEFERLEVTDADTGDTVAVENNFHLSGGAERGISITPTNAVISNEYSIIQAPHEIMSWMFSLDGADFIPKNPVLLKPWRSENPAVFRPWEYAQYSVYDDIITRPPSKKGGLSGEFDDIMDRSFATPPCDTPKRMPPTDAMSGGNEMNDTFGKE